MSERREGLQVEQAADLFDNLQMASGRDFEVQRLNLEREELSLVKKALDSLDSGTYGECSDCGEEISRKRLEVMPWAVRCLSCQEKFEAVSKEEQQNPGRWESQAA